MAYPLLLHGAHQNASQGPAVTYEPLGAWMVPWRFDSLEAEYRALHTAVGLIDYSCQALIEVTGPDRAELLHQLLTNDIKRLGPGAGCRAALVTEAAKLIAPLLVLADRESHWLICDAMRAPAVTQMLERHIFSEQVTLTNHERRHAVLAIQGPRTIEFLIQALATIIALPHPGDHLTCVFQGLPLRLIRFGLTRGVGVLVVCRAEDAQELWERLRRLGHAFGLRLVGWEALNVTRIEAGVPWIGLDMDESTLLPETGLEATLVSEHKGCYLGQEIIARVTTYGSVAKKLMGLLIDGEEVPTSGSRIDHAGKEAGWITSACRSLALKRPIALGYVSRDAYAPNTSVTVATGAGTTPALVVARPLTTANIGQTPAGESAF